MLSAEHPDQAPAGGRAHRRPVIRFGRRQRLGAISEPARAAGGGRHRGPVEQDGRRVRRGGLSVGGQARNPDRGNRDPFGANKTRGDQVLPCAHSGTAVPPSSQAVSGHRPRGVHSPATVSGLPAESANSGQQSPAPGAAAGRRRPRRTGMAAANGPGSRPAPRASCPARGPRRAPPPMRSAARPPCRRPARSAGPRRAGPRRGRAAGRRRGRRPDPRRRSVPTVRESSRDWPAAAKLSTSAYRPVVFPRSQTRRVRSRSWSRSRLASTCHRSRTGGPAASTSACRTVNPIRDRTVSRSGGARSACLP